MAYYGHHQGGDYPRQNMYTDQHRPYADPPSPAAPEEEYDSPDQYYHQATAAYPNNNYHGEQYAYEPEYHNNDGYSANDFVSPERDGRGVPGGRQTTYPPASSDPDLLDKEGAFAYEKPTVPVTRGSIAAQVRSCSLDSACDSCARPRLFADGTERKTEQLAAEGQIPKKEGLRMFRKDEHAGALTRGGRVRCCGRVFCCSVMLIILILVAIVAAFFRELPFSPPLLIKSRSHRVDMKHSLGETSRRPVPWDQPADVRERSHAPEPRLPSQRHARCASLLSSPLRLQH